MARKPRSQDGTYTRTGIKPANAKEGRAFAAGWTDAAQAAGFRPDYERTLGPSYEYGRLYAVAVRAAGIAPPLWTAPPYTAYPAPLLQAVALARRVPGWADPIPMPAPR